MTRLHRIGLVVPSSNVTVETEMPLLLGRHASARFSFHSSRMRMQQVSDEELAEMNAQRERCVDELADAGVDAVLYACLVALMAQGYDTHRQVEDAVSGQFEQRGLPMQVTLSAGALLEALEELGATRVGVVTPYVRPIAEKVVAYLEAAGVEVVDCKALEIADNAEVGRIPGERVMAVASGLDLSAADALIISLCVQMPSLDLITEAEERFGLPVLSAATAGAFALLRRLQLDPVLEGAGRLLDGRSLLAHPTSASKEVP